MKTILWGVVSLTLPIYAWGDHILEASSLMPRVPAQSRQFISGESIDGYKVAEGAACESFHAMAVTCSNDLAPHWMEVNPESGSCILKCLNGNSTHAIPSGKSSDPASKNHSTENDNLVWSAQ